MHRVWRQTPRLLGLVALAAYALLAPTLAAQSFSLQTEAAGLAERCEIQVSYAIGVAEPTSISVNSFGTGKLADEAIAALIGEHFDLRAGGLVAMLDLKRPIYQATAAYGHFGRTESAFSWEQTDKAELLKEALASAIA